MNKKFIKTLFSSIGAVFGTLFGGYFLYYASVSENKTAFVAAFFLILLGAVFFSYLLYEK